MSLSIAEAAEFNFSGDSIKVAEVMPNAEEWRTLYSALWVLIQVLNDDRDTLAGKMAIMEKEGISKPFLDMLDSARDQTEALHGLMKLVEARVVVAAAKASLIMEGAE